MLYGELPTVTLDGGQEVQGIKLRLSNPPKTAIVRLPTETEMLTRLAKQKTIRKSLGRGKSVSEPVQNPDADLALFDSIRLDKGEEFDSDEAHNIIGKLTSCEAVDCERESEGYKITLRTPFGETIHHTGSPTLRDLALYRRSCFGQVDLRHGQEELSFRPQVAAALYDSVVTVVEGYAAGIGPKDVPPHHKSTVALELAQADDANELFAPLPN